MHLHLTSLCGYLNEAASCWNCSFEKAKSAGYSNFPMSTIFLWVQEVKFMFPGSHELPFQKVGRAARNGKGPERGKLPEFRQYPPLSAHPTEFPLQLHYSLYRNLQLTIFFRFAKMSKELSIILVEDRRGEYFLFSIFCTSTKRKQRS